MNPNKLHIVVLAGGPDAEHAVSVMSATAIAEALRTNGSFGNVSYLEIDLLTQEELHAIPGDVFFPALHGRWGEGGPLQELLEADGRPFVGSGSDAALLAMDKLRTLECARRLGIPIAQSVEFDRKNTASPLPLPVVIKPVDDGSSVNVFICDSADAYARACAQIARAAESSSTSPTTTGRFMVEQFIPGRELTVSIIGETVQSIIEIVPCVDFYDYDAKYDRDDTQYLVSPKLPDDLTVAISAAALRLHRAIGCNDLSRVDFRFDEAVASAGNPMAACFLLEINTMPGFTTHSLVPMGAWTVHHLSMSDLCAELVTLAITRHSQPPAGVATSANPAAIIPTE